MGPNIIMSVHHNMELAHRLYTLPGKCQNIHGHGMQVTLNIQGPLVDGYARDLQGEIIEFGAIKKAFRAYIDGEFDHRLHLNENDPWAGTLAKSTETTGNQWETLPGLHTWPGDPSTENFAWWIKQWAFQQWPGIVHSVEIKETETNGVLV